jgi:hypothetical protein
VSFKPLGQIVSGFEIEQNFAQGFRSFDGESFYLSPRCRREAIYKQIAPMRLRSQVE